jgi:hypothetical protein
MYCKDTCATLCDVMQVNTLWGSFEIHNVRLVRTMLTQFAM